MIELWQAENSTQDSVAFTIQPGEVAMLVATGFKARRVKAAATELDAPQLACLRRLIFNCAPGAVVALEPTSYCDYLYEQGALVYSIVCDDTVSVNGKTLGLSKCNNTMFLALPGTYYFHLNDATAVGQAQVWIEKYKIGEIPSALLTQFTGECHG